MLPCPAQIAFVHLLLAALLAHQHLTVHPQQHNAVTTNLQRCQKQHLCKNNSKELYRELLRMLQIINFLGCDIMLAILP